MLWLFSLKGKTRTQGNTLPIKEQKLYAVDKWQFNTAVVTNYMDNYIALCTDKPTRHRTDPRQKERIAGVSRFFSLGGDDEQEGRDEQECWGGSTHALGVTPSWLWWMRNVEPTLTMD